MMEIKFRAWDKLKNEMLAFDDIDLMWLPNGALIINNEENDVERGGPVVLMQYTGLKDKNGKEIYEGDIIEQSDAFIVPIASNGEGRVLEIKWSDTNACCCFYINGICQRAVDVCFEQEIKVIGNINENPELLNEHSRH